MEIDLNKLVYEDNILIDENISYSKDYIKNTDIKELNNVKIDGNISKDYEDNIVIKLDVIGTMYLEDSISLDKVPYDFNIEIEEILENSLKTLDLIEFLWHYIVLEIPIRYTICSDMELKSKYKDIYTEEDIQSKNNPFKDFFKE